MKDVGNDRCGGLRAAGVPVTEWIPDERCWEGQRGGLSGPVILGLP